MTQATSASQQTLSWQEPRAQAAGAVAWSGTEPALIRQAWSSLEDAAAYQRDFLERTILFCDTLRQRADNMLAHERAGKPPLLDFDYELIADARRFNRPTNYALLRITRYGDKCLEDCLDLTKPPVIIVDPRAGHGPGIGGFKRESEVGIALHEGYPVYFVVFYPEPAPDQTLGGRAPHPEAIRGAGCRVSSRQTADTLRQLPGRLGDRTPRG